MASADLRWSFLGLNAPILENRDLRVTLLPEVGGRIWSIISKRHDRELLWHNPRIQPRRIPFGAVYDDVWCGGWEEVFPNDAPGKIGGESYPDHGEVWTLPWECRTDGDTLVLSCVAPISGVRLTKRVSLELEPVAVRVDYRIENPTGTAMPFLWKVHSAIAVSPGCRLRYPTGMSAELEPDFPGTLDSPASALVSEAPDPARRDLHFHYGTGYTEGSYFVSDPRAGLSWGLRFDHTALPACWTFASYGGWRNYYVLVIEPATTHPFRIEQAISRGLARLLAPGAAFETTVRLELRDA